MRRRRWKSKPSNRSSKKKVFMLAVLIMFLFSFQTFIFVEKNLRTPLMNLAKIRLKQIATQAVNAAVTDQITSGSNLDQLIQWQTDQSGKVTGMILNSAEDMKITESTVNTVQTILNKLTLENDTIPMGEAFNSAIMASFGPNIPIKMKPAGAVQVDLNYKVQNAGINMVLVEVYLKISVQVMIIIPFDTEPEVVETELPVSYVLVKGDVPQYYFDNNGNSVGGGSLPNISLPNGSVENSGSVPSVSQGFSSNPTVKSGSNSKS